MTIKWDRQSLLVLLSLLAILLGAFYYGYGILVEPVQTTAESSGFIVAEQDRVLAAYPPTDDRLAEAEERYNESTAFLPGGEAIHESIEIMESLAYSNDVNLSELSRTGDRQSIEGVSEPYVRSTYQASIQSSSSQDMRSYLEELMEEDRMWDLTSFTFERDGNDSYSGNFTLDLYYHVSDEN